MGDASSSGLHEMETRLTAIHTTGGETWLEFESTPFYPGGGGQPCDTGMVSGEGFSAPITEAARRGGIILHRTEKANGTPLVGMRVRLAIDSERRSRLSRMHTAEHILFRSLELILRKKNVKLSLSKISLGTERSLLVVESPLITWEDVFEAETLANGIIRKDAHVRSHRMSKEELRAFSEGKAVRINETRIPGDSVTIVEVEGFDHSACTGTHVRSAGEVGLLLVTGLNRARGRYELTFVADALPEALSLARQARNLAARLQVPLEGVQARVESMLSGRDALVERVRQLSLEQAREASSEVLRGITLVSAEVDAMEQRQLTERADSLLAARSVVCLVNRTAKNAQVLLIASKDLNTDIPGLLARIVEPLGGRGGGRGLVGMAGCPLENAGKVIPSLREALRERTWSA